MLFQSSVDNNVTLKWRTAVAVEDSLCRISVAKGKFSLFLDINDSSSYIVLKPVDIEVNENGTFECNRRADAYETITINFPHDFVCDNCILQFVWFTPNETYYACTDAAILGNQTKECPGECLNGGVCVDGTCLCVKSYYGELCENMSKNYTKQ